MAWCHQATSHYLSQCWLRSLLPYDVTRAQWVKSLRLRQNGRHFLDDIFKCIFLNENVWIVPKISLNFIPEVRINNIQAFSNNGLALTRWQAIIWTNDGWFTDTCMCHSASMSYWPLGEQDVIWKCSFQSCFTDWYLHMYLGQGHQMNTMGPHWWYVNIG